jgi:hypothetical protein
MCSARPLPRRRRASDPWFSWQCVPASRPDVEYFELTAIFANFGLMLLHLWEEFQGILPGLAS